MMDRIDRQDAQMAVQDHYNKDHGFRSYEDGQRMLNRINALPSAQKTGKWIPGKEISLTMLGNTVLERQYADYTCSECSHKYKKMPEGYFCQYCGSQNRGKEE